MFFLHFLLFSYKSEYLENEASLAEIDQSHDCMTRNDDIPQNKDDTETICNNQTCMTTSQTFDIIDPIDLEPPLNVIVPPSPIVLDQNTMSEKVEKTSIENVTEESCFAAATPTPPPTPSLLVANNDTPDEIVSKPELAITPECCSKISNEANISSTTTSFEEIAVPAEPKVETEVETKIDSNPIEEEDIPETIEAKVETNPEPEGVVDIDDGGDDDDGEGGDDCSCTTTGTRSPSEIHPAVHFEITKAGKINVISEKESFL